MKFVIAAAAVAAVYAAAADDAAAEPKETCLDGIKVVKYKDD